MITVTGMPAMADVPAMTSVRGLTGMRAVIVLRLIVTAVVLAAVRCRFVATASRIPSAVASGSVCSVVLSCPARLWPVCPCMV